MNAALHAVGLRVGAPWAVAPLLAGLGLIGTIGCARRLWPKDGRVAGVAALLYLTSAQVWVTAMTPYAMTAHLAVNACWLWLVLIGTRGGHVGAMGLTWLGTGLHQYVFHPLFALPFVALFAWRREWRLATLHGGNLALAALFWFFWADLVLPGGETPDRAATKTAHILALLTAFDPGEFGFAAASALRLLAWQNVALLALVASVVPALLRRRDPFVVALTASVLAAPLFTALVVPYQFHGWGYRYAHGNLASLFLLGAYGAQTLAARGVHLRGLLTVGTLGTAFAAAFLVSQAHRQVAPFAALERDVRALGPGLVVLDDQAAIIASDFAVNPPAAPGAPQDQVRVLRSGLPSESGAASRPCPGAQASSGAVETDLHADDPITLAWRCVTLHE